MNFTKIIFLFIFISFSFFSCKKKNKEENKTNQIVTRLAISPGGLNPVIHLSSNAREINKLIFSVLANYDAKTLLFEPIMITELPKAQKITDGPLTGGIKYKFEILKSAKWDDGSEVQADDYISSIKSVIHPKTKSIKYRAYLNNLSDVIADPENNKIFTVYFTKHSIAAMELMASFPIMPKHIYDPLSILDNISIEEMRNEEKYQSMVKTIPMLDSFAVKFNSNYYSQKVIQGAGPYQLKEWLSDQYIVLQKKENYWGASQTATSLQAIPNEIIFQITPDNAAGYSQFKAGQFDIYAGLSSQQTEYIQGNENLKDKYDFHQVRTLRYYALYLNNRNPVLKDEAVRNALAHLTNIDTIISSYEKGLAERVNSPFFLKEKNSDLQNIKFNRKKANQLLADAGWKDTNKNDILDKMVDGELVELELDMVGTGSSLGQIISGTFKQNSLPSGIKINIINVEQSQYKKKLLRRDFDIVIGVKGHSLAPYDPYSFLHSDNIDPGEGNHMGYNNPKCDKLIELIRSTTDDKERTEAYKNLENILYTSQPVIFLYAPMLQVATKKGVKGVISVQNPGFAINTFSKN